jgi:hypothetical protein
MFSYHLIHCVCGLLAKDISTRFETYSTNTGNKRWEPVSASASAAIGTASDMVSAGGGIFLKPYEEFKRSQKGAEKTGERENGARLAGNMTLASMKSIGKFYGSFFKGTLVDIPVALTEGLQAIPGLYGDAHPDYGKVTDWKSGLKTAGKVSNPLPPISSEAF